MSFVFIYWPQTFKASIESSFITSIFPVGVFFAHADSSINAAQGKEVDHVRLRVFQSPPLGGSWMHKHTAPPQRLLCHLQATQPHFPAQCQAENLTRVLKPPHGFISGEHPRHLSRDHHHQDSAVVIRLDVLHHSSLCHFHETALSHGSSLHLSYEFLIFVAPGLSVVLAGLVLGGLQRLSHNTNND